MYPDTPEPGLTAGVVKNAPTQMQLPEDQVPLIVATSLMKFEDHYYE
jgi:hypothetical protein